MNVGIDESATEEDDERAGKADKEEQKCQLLHVHRSLPLPLLLLAPILSTVPGRLSS